MATTSPARGPHRATRGAAVPAAGPAAVPGRVLRAGPWSVRVDPRSVAVCVVLAAGTALLGCWAIAVGDFPLSLGDVVRALGPGTAGGDAELIVSTLRLPRVLLGALVGAAFAAAGAIFQSLAQNPLASPDVIGFDAGAALGAVLVIVTLDQGSAAAVSAGAVAGGFAAAALVLLLAWRGGVQGYRLVLVGIGIGFALSAVIDLLLTRARLLEAQRATLWLAGSLNGRGWDEVRPVALGLLVLLPLVAALARQARLLELGADTAAALGVRVGRTRALLAVAGVALAALATAAAGPVAFVALVSPPIARRLVAAPGFTLLPAALVGAVLTVAADLGARRLLAPTELPVGIATAALGAPYLLWLLTREIRTGAM